MDIENVINLDGSITYFVAALHCERSMVKLLYVISLDSKSQKITLAKNLLINVRIDYVLLTWGYTSTNNVATIPRYRYKSLEIIIRE